MLPGDVSSPLPERHRGQPAHGRRRGEGVAADKSRHRARLENSGASRQVGCGNLFISYPLAVLWLHPFGIYLSLASTFWHLSFALKFQHSPLFGFTLSTFTYLWLYPIYITYLWLYPFYIRLSLASPF